MPKVFYQKFTKSLRTLKQTKVQGHFALIWWCYISKSSQSPLYKSSLKSKERISQISTPCFPKKKKKKKKSLYSWKQRYCISVKHNPAAYQLTHVTHFHIAIPLIILAFELFTQRGRWLSCFQPTCKTLSHLFKCSQQSHSSVNARSPNPSPTSSYHNNTHTYLYAKHTKPQQKKYINCKS